MLQASESRPDIKRKSVCARDGHRAARPNDPARFKMWQNGSGSGRVVCARLGKSEGDATLRSGGHTDADTRREPALQSPFRSDHQRHGGRTACAAARGLGANGGRTHEDRHHRGGAYRQHGRGPAGQGRSPGPVLVPPSRGTAGPRRGARAARQGRHAGRGDRVRRRRDDGRALQGLPAARARLREGARRQSGARCRQRHGVPRRRSRRRGAAGTASGW